MIKVDLGKMKIVLVVKDGGEIGILPPAQHLEWKHNRIKTPFLSCFSWASMKRRRWCILKDHRVVSREPQRPRRHGGVAAAALQTPESCCLSVGTSALSLKTSTGAWTGKTWRCQRFPSDSQHIPFNHSPTGRYLTSLWWNTCILTQNNVCFFQYVRIG